MHTIADIGSMVIHTLIKHTLVSLYKTEYEVSGDNMLNKHKFGELSYNRLYIYKITLVKTYYDVIVWIES